MNPRVIVGVQPLHRAIVWQDRRTAAICAELTEAGHLPLVRATTGLVLDPYFSATKAAWLLRSGELALGAGDARLSFCTVDSWVLWNLTGDGKLEPKPYELRDFPEARQRLSGDAEAEAEA